MEMAEIRNEDGKLEAEDRSDVVMSLFVKEEKMERVIGVAIVNMAERRMLVSEFIDNEFFSNLENMILQLTSNETDCPIKFKVICPFGAFYHLTEKLKDLFSVCEVSYTEVGGEDFNTLKISYALKMLLNPKAKFLLNEAEMDVALTALAGGVSYLKLLVDQTNYSQFILEAYRHTQFMRLDVAATRALDVFPTKFGMSVGKSFAVDSIYGLLNKCKTRVGSRLLKKWLMQPLQDREEIETRLKIVEFLKEQRVVRQTLQADYLRLLPDIEVLSSRFYKTKVKKRQCASLSDCVKAYNMVQALKSIAKFMADSPECCASRIISERYSAKIAGWCSDFSKLEELVQLSIDLERVSNHEYVIHPRFSEELRKIREIIDTSRQRIEELRVQTEIDLHSTKPIKLVESNTHTFLFEMEKKEGSDKIRQSKKNYKAINAKSRVLSFTCNELISLCKEYTTYLSKYRTQQAEVTNRVLQIVASYYPIMEATSATIAELDVLISFATVADTAPKPYVKPNITEGGNLRLFDSRHPLIEWNKPSECISNNCEFDYDSHTLHIITGLNMGGKSTYIRQVGICVYMAHVGCFVPCASADIPLIDCIVARVGAADHQLRGISTFMAEMLEVSCMIKSATPHSLLLVDEIGRGTSTSDGFGLAWAIAVHIAQQLHCLCLFATHFNELTLMAEQIKKVKNYFVEAAIKEGSITMLYKVKEGSIDKSYGIHVLEMLNFPPEIIREASQTLKELEQLSEVV